jgi:hypothetical protein
MIRKNTVLILGAGSSMPYDFPSGIKLRDAIRSLHNINERDPRLELYDKCDASFEDIRGLGKAFLYSGVDSIDAFLEKHPPLVNIGKLVIARAICERENPQAVIGRTDDNWYEYLWNYMHRDIAQADQVGLNNIRVLTFNYDRSLEFFLYTATKHTFHADNDTALDASQRVLIRHIYGSVGEFHHTKSDTARVYSPDLTAARLRLATDGIKIIPNARKDDAVFQEAREWFDWAEDICFLGFGFDKTNCERLGLEDAIQTRQKGGRSTPRVLASVLGLTQEDINAAIVATCRTTGFVPLNHSNLMALRSTNLFRE